jgi:aminoglycoside phosphotransferase (APT) family kinase protein
MTAEAVCVALRDAGVAVVPAEITLEARDGRWLVRLPGLRIAWFASDARGIERLRIERRILRLLHQRCRFEAPRVLSESDEGWDVRAIVSGVTDAWALYRRATSDPALARKIGRALGLILVEQHTCISQDDASGWLPTRLGWPEPREWMRARLPNVVDDRGLLRDIDRVLDAYDGVNVAGNDRVLVHGDLGFHNMAVDPDTSDVRGVFDYDGAGWADRHHDFRYLLFDLTTEAMLEGALAVYEPVLGRPLRRDRIRLYNAACAISYLAFRRGVPADQTSCGRTLAEDLQWVRRAIARL